MLTSVKRATNNLLVLYPFSISRLKPCDLTLTHPLWEEKSSDNTHSDTPLEGAFTILPANAAINRFVGIWRSVVIWQASLPEQVRDISLFSFLSGTAAICYWFRAAMFNQFPGVPQWLTSLLRMIKLCRQLFFSVFWRHEHRLTVWFYWLHAAF